MLTKWPLTGPVGSNPTTSSMLINCPTCHSAPGEPVPNGWGHLMQTWDAWPCNYCGVTVCNHPRGDLWTCYVRHVEEHHSEVHQLDRKPTEGGKKNHKRKR